MTTASVITEKQFLTTVVEMAEAYGWLVYHQLDQGGRDEEGRAYYGRRIGSGFPDLVLVRPPVFLIRELKSEKGKVSENQAEWIQQLLEAGVDADVWRPSDLDSIEKVLAAAPEPRSGAAGACATPWPGQESKHRAIEEG